MKIEKCLVVTEFMLEMEGDRNKQARHIISDPRNVGTSIYSDEADNT